MVADDDAIADDIISAKSKHARSYHGPYGNKTYGEIKRLAKQGGREGEADEEVDRATPSSGREATPASGTLIMGARAPQVALKRGLATVWRHWRAKRYDQALEEVERLLKTRCDNTRLLLLRAALIQLQDDETPSPTLDDARADLELAVSLDDRSPEALIDLAYFLYAVDDNANEAAKYFRRATQLCRRFLKEALVGQAGALAELEQDSKAAECLIEAYHLAAQNGQSDVRDILERLESLRRSD